MAERAVIEGLLLDGLQERMGNHPGLSLFAKERAKFEGWLKVEVCEILSHHFEGVCPERNRVDVCLPDTLIELKTVNTSLRYQGASNKHRPITKNIEGVLEDVIKLGKLNEKQKFILFVVFPAKYLDRHWQEQFKKIESKVSNVFYREFAFQNKLPGIIYLCKVF